jgi:hypothetical protein
MLSVLRASLHSDDTEYPLELARAVRKMRAQTVWLEPIALEPLPNSANLLAALLVRIDRAVQTRTAASGKGAGDATDRGRGSALALMSDQQSALLQLQRLQTAVAVAWDGNLPARGGYLDPDTYAVELVRAEQSRLSIKSELSVCLDALADAFYAVPAPVTNPLFVLPVDDVDLDPSRCLEILKLLRLVQAPRLFVIVLGNLQLVDLVLNLQYSNELASAYQGRSLKTLSAAPYEVAQWAGQVAANALAKLIPLAQRIHLEQMSVRESLNFRPLSAVIQRRPTLHQLFARFPLEAETGYATLYDLKNFRQFLLLGARYYKDKVIDVRESHYSAKNILKAPPRRIADWWSAFQWLLDRVASIKRGAATPDQKTTAIKVHKEMLRALGRVCYWAINEDNMLPTDIRSRYRWALRINPAGIWELVEPVDSVPDIDNAYTLHGFRYNAEDHPWNGMERMDLSLRVYINHGRGWYFRPAKAPALFRPVIVDLEKELTYVVAGGISVPRFNEDSTYALMLLHDLLGLGPQAEVMTQSVQINPPYERWAFTAWSGPRTRAWMPWPAPIFESFWENDLFVSYWNRVVEDCDKFRRRNSVEKTLEASVYGWIDAACAVWTGEQPSQLGDPEDFTHLVDPLPWEKLAEKVAGLISLDKASEIQRVVKGPRVMEWLLRLAYFISPALSGVRSEVAKAFGEQERLRDEWKRSKELITRFHKEIIEFFRGKGMQDLADRVEEAWVKHLNVLFRIGSPPSPPSS